jgi:hypothetical protein
MLNVQKLEQILSTDHTKDHSAFHAELHKIQELDSNNGILDVDRYKKDISEIQKHLQADGYLPKFEIFLKEDEAR